MNTFDNGDVRATVLAVLGTTTHALTSEGHDASEDGTGRGTPIVVESWQGGSTQDHFAALDGVAPTLAGTGGAHSGHHQPKVETPTGVRRLTPVECERLQGFPDDWTAVRDTDTPQADSSRYRQLGNAVAVPVVEWILGRLVATDSQENRMSEPTNTYDYPSRAASASRVAEFARQYAMKRDGDPSGLIYSIHFDADAEPAELNLNDLAALVRMRRVAAFLVAAWVDYCDADDNGWTERREQLADHIDGLMGQLREVIA